MARADLLLDIVRAGAEGDSELFRRALEALIAEERGKQHNVLADRLAEHLAPAGSRAQLSKPVDNERHGGYGYVEVIPRRSLSELVLSASSRQACQEVVEEHYRVDLLRSHNLEPRHRILAIGPPGNGKTTLAEALAFELAVPLLVVRYEGIIGSFLGETAARLSAVFAEVRTVRCVLFFDEFDVVGKERGDVHETGEIKRVVSSLLLQIDHLPPHVLVVAATNHSELLDRAVWRRFQVQLDLPRPTKAQRLDWLRRFEARCGIPLGDAREQIARKLHSVSFAELEQFALDVQRRRVLALPDADIVAIVADRLKQWAHRLRVNAMDTTDTE